MHVKEQYKHQGQRRVRNQVATKLQGSNWLFTLRWKRMKKQVTWKDLKLQMAKKVSVESSTSFFQIEYQAIQGLALYLQRLSDHASTMSLTITNLEHWKHTACHGYILIEPFPRGKGPLHPIKSNVTGVVVWSCHEEFHPRLFYRHKFCTAWNQEYFSNRKNSFRNLTDAYMQCTAYI